MLLRREVTQLRMERDLPKRAIVRRAAEVLDADERTTRRAIKRLCDATILTQAGTSKRNRIYEATDIMDLHKGNATINPSGWHTARPRRCWHRQRDHTPAPT